MKVNRIREYSRVMNQVNISDGMKHRIAVNCARYTTLKKIKSRKFTVTAVIKEKTTDRI
ncbi:MAG: hypothetical protein IKK49_03415 [Clostridia bacterium]|nr:hypothetical protein [Clostridia bacterium]MBR3754138.1 hypothetical protein [Clostridia bacterium]